MGVMVNNLMDKCMDGDMDKWMDVYNKMVR